MLTQFSLEPTVVRNSIFSVVHVFAADFYTLIFGNFGER